MRRTNKNQDAFTLIELLVVIAIIGLLAGVIIVMIASGRVKARNAKRLADIKQIATALEQYNIECGSYPWLPVSTTGILLDNTKALFSGTSPTCGDNMGTLPNGGIGTPHAAGNGETLYIAQLTQPTRPVDDGSLATGSKCSEANTQLSGSTWNDFVYVNFLPGKYYIFFCISESVNGQPAGRKILTERGILNYTGVMFP